MVYLGRHYNNIQRGAAAQHVGEQAIQIATIIKRHKTCTLGNSYTSASTHPRKHQTQNVDHDRISSPVNAGLPQALPQEERLVVNTPQHKSKKQNVMYMKQRKESIHVKACMRRTENYWGRSCHRRWGRRQGSCLCRKCCSTRTWVHSHAYSSRSR